MCGEWRRKKDARYEIIDLFLNVEQSHVDEVVDRSGLCRLRLRRLDGILLLFLPRPKDNRGGLPPSAPDRLGRIKRSALGLLARRLKVG